MSGEDLASGWTDAHGDSWMARVQAFNRGLNAGENRSHEIHQEAEEKDAVIQRQEQPIRKRMEPHKAGRLTNRVRGLRTFGTRSDLHRLIFHAAHSTPPCNSKASREGKPIHSLDPKTIMDGRARFLRSRRLLDSYVPKEIETPSCQLGNVTTRLIAKAR